VTASIHYLLREDPHPNPPPHAWEGTAEAGLGFDPPPQAGEGRVGSDLEASSLMDRSE
jgi:hypothetical protein